MGLPMTLAEVQDFTSWIKCLYGDPGLVFSSLLRAMILPSVGHELYVADFSKIEVAVLWWLADNEPGLKILRAGLDPYKYMASANTGKDYAQIEDEGDERQLGKAQVLGCGFGMGWRKFQQSAFDMYRLKLTAKQSKDAVRAYRQANAGVPVLWEQYEANALASVKTPGALYKAGKCSFQVFKKFLWVTLPSGRRLAYREPQIAMRMRETQVEQIKVKSRKTGEYIWRDIGDDEMLQSWAESGHYDIQTITRHYGPFETLEFCAVNSKTKKWGLERTWGGTLTENIAQAVARDLMMQASVRLEKAGYKFLLSVHDEAITEKIIGEGSLKEFTMLMTRKPKWAGDMPVEAKAWRGPRYRK